MNQHQGRRFGRHGKNMLTKRHLNNLTAHLAVLVTDSIQSLQQLQKATLFKLTYHQTGILICMWNIQFMYKIVAQSSQLSI